ncbi:MAG TPA: M15 family metallopeptidase [Clostridiales bacterium]|nr:M15 family metallopeptidase [Clostridiales bacterium]
MKEKSGKILIFAIIVVLLVFALVGLKKNLGKGPENKEGTPTNSSTQIAGEVGTTGGESQTSTETQSDTTVETQTATETPTTKTSTTKAQVQTTKFAGPDRGYYYNYAGVNPMPAKIDGDKWYLLLVNFDYCLPKGYSFERTGVGNNTSLDSRVAPHFAAMKEAAKKEGKNIVPISGYRSLDTQERLFNQTVNEYKNQGFDDKTSVEKASKRRQPPGCSEHNAGLAMDVCEIRKTFENTAEFKWLQENAADYGFILRYPKDKVNITGVQYEPWHWRYVGVEAAREIKERGICLEEYLSI